MSEWNNKVFAAIQFFRSPFVESPLFNYVKIDRHNSRDAGQVLSCEVEQLQFQLAIAKEALELIAVPKRADGTYNRGREACEELAKDTLEKLK